MTKDTSASKNLEAQIANAPAKTTVFSDGSTFDYENGYKSNGAPVATRDRKEAPSIVKTGAFITFTEFTYAFIALLLLLTVAAAVVCGAALAQISGNKAAIEHSMNESGQAKVLAFSMDEGEIILKNSQNGAVYACDISVASDEQPTAFIFCEPGKAATFSIPVPHDPSDVFYTAPKEDTHK